jgi:MFS family permease
MASQNKPGLPELTSEELGTKRQAAGFPDSRPPTIETVVDHNSEEKGVVSSLDNKGAPGSDVFTIPDGGWRAWSVVMGSFLILFSTFGYINAFGVYQSYYSQHLGKSDSNISWIGSFQIWMLFSLGAPAGKLFDEGYCRHLIAGGSLIYVFSLFMLSITKNQFYQVLLAQAVGSGIGAGLMFLPATSVIAHWFSRKRSYAVGVVISGSSLGGVVFPIMLNKLIVKIGFSLAVRATAYLILGCLVIANTLIAPRLPPRRLRPADMQLPKPDMKRILTHRPYQLAVLGGFFTVWGLFLPFFYLQIYAQSQGIDENIAFYSLSILNAASIFGRILPNFVADKIGPYNMILPFSFATAVLIFAWLGVSTSAGLIVFALLYGFFSGALISLLPSILMALASNVGEVGIRIGIGFFGTSFGCLTGTPIAGALLGDDLQWWKPTVFAGVSVFVGTICMVIARHLHSKDKGTWKV